ncbi:MAG: hypothetical protein QXZ02_02345 [Candidatus Bathyarchaeia archaeon]
MKQEMEKTPKQVFNDDLIVRWHKCDICRKDAYAVYILQLDKWYCANCIHMICELLESSQ